MVAVLAISGCLGACGKGGDSTTIDPDAVTPERTSTDSPMPTARAYDKAPGPKVATGVGGRPGKKEKTDPPTPGFHDGSGQTDIPAFGIEAHDRDRMEAQAVLGAYLEASRNSEWAKACGYLLDVSAAEISALAKELPHGAEKGCPAALPRVFAAVGGFRDVYMGTVRLSGLRIKQGAGAGFALFRGSDGRDYWMSLKIENGQWRILSAFSSPLDPYR